MWTAALQGVLHPQLFWSPSIVNPDMTFSRSGRDLGEAFQALRFEGIGRLLMEAERLDDGVAVHYSMPSVHAAGILGQHDREEAKDEGDELPANRDGWVSVARRPGPVVPLPGRAAGRGGRARGASACFVLPYSLALSDREAAEIRRFVEEGGLLLADAGSRALRRARRLARAGALDALFGVDRAAARATRVALRRRAAAAPVRVTAGRRRRSASAPGELAGLEALEPAVRAQGGPRARCAWAGPTSRSATASAGAAPST